MAVLGLVVTFAGAAPALADLIGAEEVLRRFEKGAAGAQAQPQSPAAAVLVDLRRFRAEAGSLDPKQAAARWLELYDRTVALGRVGTDGDLRLFDAEIRNFLNLQSVLSSLPGPQAWPALREGAAARAAKAPANTRALTLRLLAELLSADRAAAAATLAELEGAAGKLAPKEAEAVRGQIAFARAEVARLYGSREEVAATFVASLKVRPSNFFGEVPVPDLAGLVGEASAEAILREALSKPVMLRVPEGDRTRALARRIALENVAALPVPQWALVDTIEAADLYEAMSKRFEGTSGKGAARGPVPDFGIGAKTEADAYYFLHLVITGRHLDAENALRAVAGTDELNLPKRAVDALRRAGYNEALYRFLHSLLGRRPEVRAWEVYTKQAAQTGHSADALALVDGLLKRKDLPDFVLGDLRFHRVNALLAADHIEPAVAALRELLSAPPRREERNVQSRAEAAARLTGLGRVLGRHDLTATGLSFAQAVLALPADPERSWVRDQTLKQVFAEQRKLGMAEQAQGLAIAELERSAANPNQMEQFGIGASPGDRAALIELAGIYGAAGRQRDVVRLLDESTKWGARDLGELLAEKDSLGVPAGLIAAQALAETGNKAAALGLVRALIDALPGYDPGYELLVALDTDANDYLNAVYARDRFEERPLIWKAVALYRIGRHLEAESLIRQAIVIDPSDGEEGPTDRMRAYAVLADILEAKGAAAQAAIFRGAVQAIRISERSDELHRLGLYERAFAGYREALGHFSDAYCIQSRLAVRLNEQGRHKEAFEHYRRAYELMPSSFGRVESHCFGCESVFQGPAQQKIAEQVFTGMLAKEPAKPQLHYLLGYLQKERGLYGDALKRFRESVALDPEYLNAWKHLHEIGSHVYVDAAERDLARLKLLELDPGQRHVRYELDSVGDLAALWRALQSAEARSKPVRQGSLYPLRRSAAAQDAVREKLPEPLRAQMEQYEAMMSSTDQGRTLLAPRQVLAKHKLVRASAQLMGVREPGHAFE